MNFKLFIIIGFCFLLPSCVFAEMGILNAKVLEIISEESVSLFEDSKDIYSQKIKLEISGSSDNQIVEATNELSRLSVGDRVFVEKLFETDNGTETYIVREVDRSLFLNSFLLLFLFSVIYFGGTKGLRSVASLLISFLVIIYFLVPSILNGYSPVLISILVSVFILFVAIYFTHGFNWVSSSAFLGTVLSVLITGILSYLGVIMASFSGLGTEEAFMLSIYGGENIDFSGLLLGATIIGTLGVLDDVSITQSAAVREIYCIKKDMDIRQVYERAMIIGREHVGAVINTLALAYAGASLPLILIFYKSEQSLYYILSQEIFSVEIMRTVVGSIGLILSVPITTFLAAYFLREEK